MALATASPFKFPAAALRALGHAVPERPEEQLDLLGEVTGLPLPRALDSLFRREICHDAVIARTAWRPTRGGRRDGKPPR